MKTNLKETEMEEKEKRLKEENKRKRGKNSREEKYREWLKEKRLYILPQICCLWAGIVFSVLYIPHTLKPSTVLKTQLALD